MPVLPVFSMIDPHPIVRLLTVSGL